MKRPNDWDLFLVGLIALIIGIVALLLATSGCQSANGDISGALDTVTDPNTLEGAAAVAMALTPWIPGAVIVSIVLTGLAGIFRKIP